MRICFGIGLGIDREYQPISPDEQKKIIAQVQKLLSEQYGRCKILKGEDAWQDDDGEIITERAIEAIADDTENTTVGSLAKADRIARTIGRLANKRAVHVAVIPTFKAADVAWEQA